MLGRGRVVGGCVGRTAQHQISQTTKSNRGRQEPGGAGEQPAPQRGQPYTQQYGGGVVVVIRHRVEFGLEGRVQGALQFRRIEQGGLFIGRKNLPEAVAAHDEARALIDGPLADFVFGPLGAAQAGDQARLTRAGRHLGFFEFAAQHLDLRHGVIEGALYESVASELRHPAVAGMHRDDGAAANVQRRQRGLRIGAGSGVQDILVRLHHQALEQVRGGATATARPQHGGAVDGGTRRQAAAIALPAQAVGDHHQTLARVRVVKDAVGILVLRAAADMRDGRDINAARARRQQAIPDALD